MIRFQWLKAEMTQHEHSDHSNGLLNVDAKGVRLAVMMRRNSKSMSVDVTKLNVIIMGVNGRAERSRDFCGISSESIYVEIVNIKQ